LPWVLRFEDIDRPRIVYGAKEQQLEDLRALGMIPDEILLQSQAIARHWALFARAVHEGQVYPCTCSRADVRAAIEASASAPNAGAAPVYSGKCRPPEGQRAPKLAPGSTAVGWRFRVPERASDATAETGALSAGSRDFIVARSTSLEPEASAPPPGDFVPAYHWACAIDDFDGAYRLLVRAWDLRPAAELQREIQHWLARAERVEREPAAVYHTALVVRDNGDRLEKRTKGVTFAELGALGVSPGELLRRFEASFDPSLLQNLLSPGALEGEPQTTMPLSELGL
jgi:glutamyl/glutaminyl-tRNA synthetase